MLCVGGACDGQQLAVAEWPPFPCYFVVERRHLILRPKSFYPPEQQQAKIPYHEYSSVQICWPSGAVKCWVLMPTDMPDHERRLLLLERGMIDA